MVALPGLARSAAGTVAVSCELLIKVVSNGVSTPPCDQTTLVLPRSKVKEFDPAIVRTRSGLPTMALLGEMEMFADGVPGRVPPQPNCQKTRLATATAENHLTPILLQIFAASAHESECMIVTLSKSSRSGYVKVTLL